MSNLSANESNVDLLRFFKALADETRLKMAALLASKPRSGEQLAELLSIKAATVSHHLSKLADAELVTSTSEGHKKFYTLRLDAVRATAQQLQAKDPGLLVPASGDTTEFYPNRVLYDEYDRRVLKDFFNSDGSLRQLPMQRKKFGAVLKHIVQDIEPGREYTEKTDQRSTEAPPPRHGQPAQRHDRLPLDGAQVGRVLASVSDLRVGYRGGIRAGKRTQVRLKSLLYLVWLTPESTPNPRTSLGQECRLRLKRP